MPEISPGIIKNASHALTKEAQNPTSLTLKQTVQSLFKEIHKLKEADTKWETIVSILKQQGIKITISTLRIYYYEILKASAANEELDNLDNRAKNN